MEVSGQLHTPSTLSPGKEPRYPMDMRLGGPQSRSRRCRKEKSYTVGNRSRAVHPVACRYTDWPIPTPITASSRCIIHSYIATFNQHYIFSTINTELHNNQSENRPSWESACTYLCGRHVVVHLHRMAKIWEISHLFLPISRVCHIDFVHEETGKLR
jgi:hypothetical protein